jgi:hypothetical protein
MNATQPRREAWFVAAAIAVLGCYGLLLQFYVIIDTARAAGVPVETAVVNYFSYFTISTNLLMTLVLTFSLWKQRSHLSNFCALPTVQTAVAVYMAIVGIVYSLVLRNLWAPEGLQKIADIVLHDATPVLYVLYWLLFVGKHKERDKDKDKDWLRFSDVPAWLWYPTIYLAYSMIRGAFTGRYLYPFMDVGSLGYPRVALNIVVLVAAFLAMSLLFVAINRWRSQTATR